MEVERFSNHINNFLGSKEKDNSFNDNLNKIKHEKIENFHLMKENIKNIFEVIAKQLQTLQENTSSQFDQYEKILFNEFSFIDNTIQFEKIHKTERSSINDDYLIKTFDQKLNIISFNFNSIYKKLELQMIKIKLLTDNSISELHNMYNNNSLLFNYENTVYLNSLVNINNHPMVVEDYKEDFVFKRLVEEHLNLNKESIINDLLIRYLQHNKSIYTKEFNIRNIDDFLKIMDSIQINNLLDDFNAIHEIENILNKNIKLTKAALNYEAIFKKFIIDNMYTVNLLFRELVLIDLLVRNKLKNIDLNCKTYAQNSQFVEVLTRILDKNFPIISSLDMRYNNLTGKECFNLFKSFYKNRTLFSLWGYFMGADYIGVSPLRFSLQFQNQITELYLSNNNIGTDGAYYIAQGIRQNKVLKHLFLSNNFISDKGMLYLSNAFAENNSLIEVDLRFNMIKDEGLQYFYRIYDDNNSNNICSVYFSNNKLNANDIRNFINKTINRACKLKKAYFHNITISNSEKEEILEIAKANGLQYELFL